MKNGMEDPKFAYELLTRANTGFRGDCPQARAPTIELRHTVPGQFGGNS